MKLRIDRVAFSYKIIGCTDNTDPPFSEFTVNLADIWLGGCRYDSVKNCIEEIREDESDSKLGIVQLIPIETLKTSTTQPQPWMARIPIYRSEHSPKSEEHLVCFIESNTKKKFDHLNQHKFFGYCEPNEAEKK